MIVAVTGGKGGVGKSTVSLNLARELDAVVVDADLSTADLPRGSGPDLHDILAGRAEPTEGVEQFGAVRVLPCGRTLAGARASDLSALPRVVERLERECGRVVIDCPTGLARDVGIALDIAHVAVLVTTPNEAALVDALRTRRLALALETPVAAGLLNRVTTSYPDRIAARLDGHLGASTATIEERPVIAEAQRRWLSVRDHDPSCPALRTALEDGAWRLPADLPLSELETRLADRLRTKYDLAAVAASIDSRGRATITAAPPSNGIAKHVPAGWRAVSIPSLLPIGLASGDDVRIVAGTATVSGTVLRVSAETAASGDESRARTIPNAGRGTVTVAVPTTDAAAVLEVDRPRLVVEPAGTSPEFDAISLLECGDESIRKVPTTVAVREAVTDDATDVDAFAVRSSRTAGAAIRSAWSFEPPVDALEIGTDAFLVGTDADEFGPESTLDAGSRPNTDPITEVRS